MWLMGKRVADMTPEEHAAVLERDRKRQRKKTPEQLAEIRAKRANLPPEARAALHEKEREREAKRRAARSPEEVEEARAYARSRVKKRADMTPEEIEEQHRKDKLRRLKDPAAWSEKKKAEYRAKKQKDPVAFQHKKTQHMLKHVWGLTLADYNALLAHQGGVCAVCKKPPGHRRLVVDHCHKTGAIRGLLHNYCNTSIVAALESPLRATAEAYLANPPAFALLSRPLPSVAPADPSILSTVVAALGGWDALPRLTTESVEGVDSFEEHF